MIKVKSNALVQVRTLEILKCRCARARAQLRAVSVTRLWYLRATIVVAAASQHSFQLSACIITTTITARADGQRGPPRFATASRLEQSSPDTKGGAMVKVEGYHDGKGPRPASMNEVAAKRDE